MSSAPFDPTAENDPLLATYLAAPSQSEAAAAMAALLSVHAGPVIEKIVQAKRPNESDAEDLASTAQALLVRQLTLLRDGERQSPIRDFRGYVASVAYSAWAEFLRERHPQRSMLLNRLRHLLENRTRQKGFAIWADETGTKWCGFAAWDGQTADASPRRHWLLVDPGAAAADALGPGDPAALVLPEMVARLFRWLAGPIELRDLTTVLAELTTARRRESAAPAESEIDPRNSPAEELVWKEYLGWLWREISTLSERQRRAFLLHSDLLRDFDSLAIASLRTIAWSLEMTAEELAEIWNEIPLDDLTIANILKCTRQQVINLRRVARDKLGDAWRNWAGNKDPKSSSE